jgi:endonuclease/exonuclease/phosphatase family metal-dependent hydrolase
MRRAAAIGVAALLVVAAACSGGDDDDGAAEPASDVPSVRVVSQNILHGSSCAPETDNCDLPARVALFSSQLEAADCPELVGLQETNQRIVDELRDALPESCGYEIVFEGDPGNDREVVLSTLPVIGSRRERLAGPLRTAFLVRVAAPTGVVDFFSTHLASSSDDRPCDADTCPPPCKTDDSLQLCQSRQVVELVDELAHPDALVVVAGDLNATVDEPTIAVLHDAGLGDSHLEAGNAECDPVTGEQCTSGRIDDAMTDLEDPTSKQSQRIDYIWHGGRDCTVGEPTGLFNGEAADGPLAFPSDHTGVIATFRCSTSDDQLAAADDAPLPTTTTTTLPAGGTPPPETAAAITTAFETLFDATTPTGEVLDLDSRLAALEDGEQMRDQFRAMYEATKDLASRIKVRIDDITMTDATHAAVVYTLLLDGSAVLDHLPGTAVSEQGTWLVSLRTYCDVATTGADTIPPACR